jgi:hypothetical protein
VTSHIQSVVSANRYDSLANCAVYALINGSPFQAKSLALIQWADSVWQYVIAEQAKLLAGQRELVSVEAFIAELPEFED